MVVFGMAIPVVEKAAFPRLEELSGRRNAEPISNVTLGK
jgi:hypothetical protein